MYNLKTKVFIASRSYGRKWVHIARQIDSELEQGEIKGGGGRDKEFRTECNRIMPHATIMSTWRVSKERVCPVCARRVNFDETSQKQAREEGTSKKLYDMRLAELYGTSNNVIGLDTGWAIENMIMRDLDAEVQSERLLPRIVSYRELSEVLFRKSR